jgi:DNA-binding transcriptional ArsR family regulator
MIAPQVELFKALGHPLRFRILATLSDGEHNVGEIEEASGIGQPALSQQLAVLRGAGLVTTRRDAKQIFYAIAPAQLERLASAVAGLMPPPSPSAGPPGGPNSASRRAVPSSAAVFAKINR